VSSKQHKRRRKMIDRIKARIAKLEKDRDDYLAEANKQLVAFNAAIGELKTLLEEPKVEAVEDAEVVSAPAAA
jgi:hypothetical protein